jgi:hypothetical protein
MENIERYIETMPLSSFPLSLLKEVDLLSFSGPKIDNPVIRTKFPKSPLIEIFGSANYRLQKYGADVDLTQGFSSSGNFEEFLKLFEKKMIKIVKTIVKKKNHYVTEVKAGLDMRYSLDVGRCMNGNYKMNPDLFHIVDQMYKEGLFNDLEYTRIKIIYAKSLKQALNQDDYDIVYNTIRERLILRWSAEEIIKGRKIVAGGYNIPLIDALKFSTPTKIDMIALYDGKFIEITNFVVLAYKIGDVYYTLNKDFPNKESEIIKFQQKGLKKEIEKLLYSDYYYGPFKAVKRTFALARVLRDKNMLQKIIPIVSGDISLLYQIRSELEADLLVMEFADNPDIKIIDSHIDKSRIRIAKVLNIPKNILITINEMINKILETEVIEHKIELLDLLNKMLKEIINYNTIISFDNVGLNPMITTYLPTDLTYKRHIISPQYLAINPLKALDKIINIKPKKVGIRGRPKKFKLIPTDDEVLESISNRVDNY